MTAMTTLARPRIKKGLYCLAALACLLPQVSSAYGLLIGVLFAALIGNPLSLLTRKWTPKLLAVAVVGLGAQMNLFDVMRTGSQGLFYTAIGIIATFALGILLRKTLHTEKETSLLIAVGTAICGGSAIAAVAPVIRARDEAISVALATVFLLNAVALLLFPLIGRALELSEAQFGLWSALSIHDTSSVVGANLAYGARALEVGTSVKLARALWILPVTFIIARLVSVDEKDPLRPRRKHPWFILGFIGTAAAVTFFPPLKPLGEIAAFAARRLMVLTLFLVGSNLDRAALVKVGFKPFLHGTLLWIFIAAGTLLWIF